MALKSARNALVGAWFLETTASRRWVEGFSDCAHCSPRSTAERTRHLAGLALESPEKLDETDGVTQRMNLAHLVSVHRTHLRRADLHATPGGNDEHFGFEIEIAALHVEERCC